MLAYKPNKKEKTTFDLALIFRQDALNSRYLYQIHKRTGSLSKLKALILTEGNLNVALMIEWYSWIGRKHMGGKFTFYYHFLIFA